MFRMSVFNWDTFIEDEIKIMKIGLTFNDAGKKIEDGLFLSR